MKPGHTPEQEPRRTRRKPARFMAVATDMITGEPFGQLGNLSSGGMLLIGSAEPRSEGLYQFRLSLPGSGDDMPLVVGAQEQWHKHVASTGQVWSGYRIIAISEQDARRLEAWLASPD